MNVKRRIDFILTSSHFSVQFGIASTALDLGSDHRSVKTILSVKEKSIYRPADKKSVDFRGWRPAGDGALYRQFLDDSLKTLVPEALFDAECILMVAAMDDSNRKCQYGDTHFQCSNAEFQNLPDGKLKWTLQ